MTTAPLFSPVDLLRAQISPEDAPPRSVAQIVNILGRIRDLSDEAYCELMDAGDPDENVREMLAVLDTIECEIRAVRRAVK